MSMFSKLNQIKELRTQAKQMQKTLGSENAEVSYRGVTMAMDGNQNLTSVKIDNELIKPERKNDLENNIKNAHEELMKKIHRIMAQKIKDSGYTLPNLK
jgi:DNA-binding protein YbaB